MDFKICFKCGKEKALKEFYKHSQMADGHLNKCIECTKKDSNKHREDNLEEVKAYDRKRDSLPRRIKAREEYAKTPNGIEAGNKAKKKWTKKNPDQRAAHRPCCDRPDHRRERLRVAVGPRYGGIGHRHRTSNSARSRFATAYRVRAYGRLGERIARWPTFASARSANSSTTCPLRRMLTSTSVMGSSSRF